MKAADRETDAAERALDELYGGPLDAFTGRRSELAREAKARGDAEAAKRIAGARKPTGVAWALDQLAHRHADGLEAFLEASDALRDAQARSLRKSAGRDGLDAVRDASRAHRAELDRLVELATAELERAGQRASAASERKLRDTLHAAAFGGEAGRELLRRGRLERELETTSGLEALGFDAMSLDEAPRARDGAKRAAKETKRARDGTKGRDAGGAARRREEKRRAREREREEARRRRDEEKKARERERREKEAMRAALAAARDAHRDAEADAREAEQAAREAERVAQRASAEAEKARARAGELRRRVTEIEEDLRRK